MILATTLAILAVANDFSAAAFMFAFLAGMALLVFASNRRSK